MKCSRRNQIQLAARRQGASTRAVQYSQLTPAQKLELLDQRLGKGVGAVRQRAKLLKQLSQPAEKPTAEVAKQVFGVEEQKVSAKKNNKKARG